MTDNKKPKPEPFKRFSDLYSFMSNKLNEITDAHSKGKAESGKAYAHSWHAVNDKIKHTLSSLSKEQRAGLWSGLHLKSKPDQYVNDLTNSLMSAWDKCASKALKNKRDDDEKQLKKSLLNRLHEFDGFINTGKAIAKDQ